MDVDSVPKEVLKEARALPEVVVENEDDEVVEKR